MKIDIYTSAKAGNKYLSVLAGTKVAALQLPDGTDPDLLTLSPFKTRLEFNPRRPLAALDEADIKTQILENGYAIHDSKITITVGESAS
jgi:hypothetical protein